MWESALDFIFPLRCVSCGSFGQYLCLGCQGNLDYFSPQRCLYCDKPSVDGLTHKGCQKTNGLDGLFVFGHYTGPLKKLVKKVKYQGVWKAIAAVAPVILNNYHFKFDFDFLVPVPLSKKREAERGFNQSYLLALSLKSGLGKDVSIADILKRTRDTKPQFDLKFSERKENVLNAFSLKETVISSKISGQSFCLVDDVATTGSTLLECAKVLKHYGAKKVFAITIARGS